MSPESTGSEEGWSKDPRIREIEERTQPAHEEAKRIWADALEEAKKDTTKEQFDLEKLREHYSFERELFGGGDNLPQADLDRLEDIYYIRYPHLKTMFELGKFLRDMEAGGEN